jgi:hypothetical protein
MLTATTIGGIADISSARNLGAFAMATVNVGASETLTISADTGDVALPLTVLVCQTQGGACVADPASSDTLPIATDETSTFSFFIVATGFISFDPANHRIIVTARGPGGIVFGRTNLAERTQQRATRLLDQSATRRPATSCRSSICWT